MEELIQLIEKKLKTELPFTKTIDIMPVEWYLPQVVKFPFISIAPCEEKYDYHPSNIDETLQIIVTVSVHDASKLETLILKSLNKPGILEISQMIRKILDNCTFDNKLAAANVRSIGKPRLIENNNVIILQRDIFIEYFQNVLG